MAKSKKVASLFEKKREILKEIDDLQKNCRHLKKTIKSLPESVDSSTFIIRWVCNECESIVGIPNNIELNNYLKQ